MADDDGLTNLAGRDVLVIDEMSVREYVPVGAETPTQVHIVMIIGSIPIALRLKSRAAALKLIDGVVKHTDSVWPPE